MLRMIYRMNESGSNTEYKVIEESIAHEFIGKGWFATPHEAQCAELAKLKKEKAQIQKKLDETPEDKPTKRRSPKKEG